MSEEVVHLHNHTEYSRLDGAARVEELVLAAKLDGQRALGITDHGNLYGVIEFYDTCRAHGVTPVLGVGRGLRTPARAVADGLPRGLLLQAARRLGAARAVRARADRHLRVSGRS